MSTFYSGAGAKLAAGLQTNGYFDNTTGCTVSTKLNITSATFDPTVEKVSEETLLQSKIKTGSLLTSITMDASFDANLRPEMTDWLFKASLQNPTVTSTTGDTGYTAYTYTLANAGVDPQGSTLVLTRGSELTDAYTYPGMTVRSLTMNMPNNDFVTVTCDLTGREEIGYGGSSQIEGSPETTYETKADVSSDYTKDSYIVTNGVFRWEGNEVCIESATLTIDNGIEASPRCYQDGKYVNIPVMGMRSITLDVNLPYSDAIDNLKDNYLLETAYASVQIEFTNASDTKEKVVVTIPHFAITSIGAGISGTGVVESTISGEAVQIGSGQPLTIVVQTAD